MTRRGRDVKTVTTIAELRAEVGTARRHGNRIGLVPTMGALHAGHLSLVRGLRDHVDWVVTSIFVNPAQFGPNEDLAAYPRDLAGDQAALVALGDAAPDVVFVPSVAEVYPRPQLTTVHVGELGDRLCGRSRPTHFDGVTTVVAKLFGMAQPDVAIFGRKDFQQLTILRRMAADLDLAVEVVGAPIVREDDGVAMSSRNRYLEAADRRAARALSRALRAAVVAGREGRSNGAIDPASIATAARRTLGDESRVRVDYVEAIDADDLAPLDGPFPAGDGSGEASPEVRGTTRLLVAVAAHVGPARLIDNVVIGDLQDEDALLAATATPEDGNP